MTEGSWSDEDVEQWANVVHARAQRRNKRAEELVAEGGVFLGSRFPDTRPDGSPHKTPLEELVSAWQATPVDSPPYLLRGDEAAKPIAHEAMSYSELTTKVPLAEAKDRKALHLGLVPVPYAGDLVRSKIFILMLNPGFEPRDYFSEERDPAYRQALVGNLYQQRAGSDFPFLYLDPAFSHTGGFCYWADDRRLGWAVREVRRQRGITMQAALSVVSKAVCVLQIVPYHSATSPGSLSPKLRSSSLIRWFVEQDLLNRARADLVSVIVTRKRQDWLPVRRQTENVVVFTGTETRGAYLTQKRAKEAIARRLDL